METIKSPAEHRVILHNTSWETYERLMKERGESRVPRFAYDRGELEIMSPSTEHESEALPSRTSDILTLFDEECTSLGSTDWPRRVREWARERTDTAP